jgi:group I intron endonuclease
MIGIYKITSPTKKVYIGQSIQIEVRFRSYKNLKSKNQPILNRSFLKYGVEKHKFEILCECEISELNELERYYQDLYLVTGVTGMNCMLTKSSDRSGKHSEKTILNFKEIRKNYSKETRLKMSKSQLGRKHSEETKIKMSKNMKGAIFSEITREKMSVSAKKRGVSKNYIDSIRKIVLDTSSGIFYDSLFQVSICFNLKYTTLRAKVSGQNKNTTNFIYV